MKKPARPQPAYVTLPVLTGTFREKLATQVKHISILEAVKTHPPTDQCNDPECYICGYRDCPFHEELHYHHDGCPACVVAVDSVYLALANMPLLVKLELGQMAIREIAAVAFDSLVAEGMIGYARKEEVAKGRAR